MILKKLGNSQVSLPEIGLGTWEYYGGIEALQKGIALGAYLIDTAEAYGTEQIVGEAIKGVRNRVFLATKVSPRHFTRTELFKAVDRSLKQLQTNYIDLYQLHAPNSAISIEETMSTMEELVDLGKIRYIGVSNFSVGEIQRAQLALRKYKIVANQVRYNLVERTIEVDLLGYCQESGVTVIAYSPLARGLDNIKKKDPKGILSKVATMTGKTEAQVALNWCITKEGVVAIPKADSLDHVVENCGASGWRLTHDQVRLLGDEIEFRRRNRIEAALRRMTRGALQRLGYAQ